LADLWNDALRGIQPRLGDQTFDMWLRPIQLRRIEDDLLRLEAPSRFLKEWFETHYLETVLDELRAQTDRQFRVEIEVQADRHDANSADGPNSSHGESATESDLAPSQLQATGADGGSVGARREPAAPAVALHPRYRFDSFIKGASNELAASAALAVADAPGTRFNPLFIYGGVGLGKTHLLHAVGHAIHRQNPTLRIVYLSAEQFMNDFVTAVRQNRFDAFRAQYRRECDCLLIDDIQFIAGRERTMDEFFHVFNALYESGKQIVVTSDRVPSDMRGMEERLTSRLNWGLVADVQAPDLETRIAIIHQKALTDGIEISRESMLLLAELIRSNVRELEGALLRVSAFASLRGVEISPEFIREVLGRSLPAERPLLTVEAIQKVVASYFSVRIADLKGPRRHRGISRPRMIAMYLCRELTGASFPEIGLRFGGKDHSTVINACNRITSLQRDDADLHAAVDSLRSQLLG
jgi:chromosomal replication initiator protein